MSPVLRVIGVGTELRGDDGAGLEVARRLAAEPPAGLEAVTCGGGVAELLDAWAGAETVVVVDATRSGAAPGTVVDLGVAGAGRAARSGGTHDAGLAEAVALGARLGRMPRRLRIVGIEPDDTGLGRLTLTAPVERAVAAVVQHLRSCAD